MGVRGEFLGATFTLPILLTWYANIPEEVTYFKCEDRPSPLAHLGNVLMNFALPWCCLSRDTKRSPTILDRCGRVDLIGHWLDMVQMIMPGSLGNHFEGVGLVEIGFFIAFLALIRTVLARLPRPAHRGASPLLGGKRSPPDLKQTTGPTINE